MNTHIPQISNVSAITNTVLAVRNGNLTSAAIAKVMGVKPRTVAYAADAAQSFGLLGKSEGGWFLTSTGTNFLANPVTLTTFIANSPAMKAYVEGVDTFFALCDKVGLSVATAARRLSTVRAWFAFAGAAVPAIVGRTNPVKVRAAVCPCCLIALPLLRKDECDTCGTAL